MKPLLATPVSDPLLERLRANHHDAIRELQVAPLAAARLIANVVLADGIDTPIAHGLGRAPVWVRESCVRGASTVGMVEELRDDTTPDRTKYVTLRASGFGADVTVDVVVA